MLLFMLAITVMSNAEVSAMGDPAPDNTPKAGERSARSETDTYIDLNTGKAFKFIYDELNDKYERDDLLALELYVNIRTRDSFWKEQAVLVNNALLRDATGIYRVNPMKVKRDGAGYKVINNNAVIKQDSIEKGDKPKEGSVSSM